MCLGCHPGLRIEVLLGCFHPMPLTFVVEANLIVIDEDCSSVWLLDEPAFSVELLAMVCVGNAIECV